MYLCVLGYPGVSWGNKTDPVESQQQCVGGSGSTRPEVKSACESWVN